MNVPVKNKSLVILDMDCTILSSTTDFEVLKLLSESELKKISQYYNFWAKYMQTAFHIMKKQSIKVEQIKKIIQNIPLTHGFKELFQFLREKRENFEIIIG